MRLLDIIIAKRDGKELSREQIQHFVREYASGGAPDYQAAALLMAAFLNGMTTAEQGALVQAMTDSGERYDHSALGRIPVDKHSTGGVGDKVSLLLAPIVASAGVPVPMISGRGLGHTGGTLDKLEAIPGFDTRLSREQFSELLARVGVAMAGQSERFVPADRKLYALRDVTGTVESIPLIASSIMSKKIAEGAKGLVLDVKTGSGAFMQNDEDALQLARTLVETGEAAGVRTVAWLTDMSQPLGRAIGNANETAEAIAGLRGDGPPDLMKVTETLCAEMLVLGEAAPDIETARQIIQKQIASGAALDKFREMVEAQGGDPRVADNPSLLTIAPQTMEIAAPRKGWIAGFDCREIGFAACVLGAGRETKEDSVDPSVGIEALKRIGDSIEAGEPLFRVFWRKQDRMEACRRRLESCVQIANEPCSPPELIRRRISHQED
ncbi:thymidine phosphorylase [Candidatus Sumerlaeota bacterium]|nr:thymidine phosphorylase [Candidatus Sumerlaeota bacterium]